MYGEDDRAAGSSFKIAFFNDFLTAGEQSKGCYHDDTS